MTLTARFVVKEPSNDDKLKELQEQLEKYATTTQQTLQQFQTYMKDKDEQIQNLQNEMKENMEKKEKEIGLLKVEVKTSTVKRNKENEELSSKVKTLERDNKTLVDVISELADTVPEDSDATRVMRLQSTENYIILKDEINKLQAS